MKKLILLSAMFMVSASFASEYTCYRYVNGKPTGTYVKVSASSKKEATIKAIEKFKKIGGKLDDVNCK